MIPEKKGDGGPSKMPGLRIAAAAAFLVTCVGSIPLRHWMRHWSETALLVTMTVIVAPFAILTLIGYFRAPKARPAVPKRRSAASWAALNEQWRQSLMVAVLLGIGLLGGAIMLVSRWLEATVPAFASFVDWLTPSVGGLAITAFSVAAVFGIAALSGPRLIRFTTGRMPMGTATRVKNR